MSIELLVYLMAVCSKLLYVSIFGSLLSSIALYHSSFSKYPDHSLLRKTCKRTLVFFLTLGVFVPGSTYFQLKIMLTTQESQFANNSGVIHDSQTTTSFSTVDYRP